MVKVITYGTFDLLHEGHLNILKKSKELGDYLIVGVTSENYDKSRGKLNVMQSLMERIENVKRTGLADEIIIEEYYGQKVEDIKKYEIDKFVIGSDWLGQFDYLKEYCEVVYIERTKGISSTQLRNSMNGILNVGIVGTGRIANRFCKEAIFVSGVNVDYAFSKNEEHLEEFIKKNKLQGYTMDYEELLKHVDAVYIASPHVTHYEYAKRALEAGKHVLCEKPITLSKQQANELYSLAKSKGLVLFEAIKTAYTQAFKSLVFMAKSGVIGEIKDIDATFTKLIPQDENLRELDVYQKGGSVTELASYPLLAIFKLLGTEYEDVSFYSSYFEKYNVDKYTRIIIRYKNAIATAQVGLGVKKEGELIISGTKGYIYVPAPWWKTEYFEIRFEDLSNTKKYYYQFSGDGLRYEIAEFIRAINSNHENISMQDRESVKIVETIEDFLNKKNVTLI